MDTDLISDGMHCDFCSSNVISWLYPCVSFNNPLKGRRATLDAESKGDWLACDTCHLHIEADARTALLNRCLLHMVAPTTLVPLTREQRRKTRPQIKKLHEQFFSHRTGPPRSFRPSVPLLRGLTVIDSQHGRNARS